MYAPVHHAWLVLVLVWPFAVSAQTQDEKQVRSGSSAIQGPAEQRMAQPAPPQQLISEDLQRIVVLCATGQYSPELDQAWRQYLRQHSVTDQNLDRLLDDIQQRAAAYRTAMYVQPAKDGSRQIQTLSAIMKSLHDTAKAVIQNMR